MLQKENCHQHSNETYLALFSRTFMLTVQVNISTHHLEGIIESEDMFTNCL